MSPFKVTGRELVSALESMGFRVARVRGSHHLLRHTDGRTTVVPVHAGEIIGPGLLAKILGVVACTEEELRRAIHHR